MALRSGPSPVHRIAIRVRELSQLFNSMDPTPFHHKDIDPDAEEFIESWALEFPPESRFEITVHLEQFPKEGEPATLVEEAVHNYFDYKSELARRELNQLLSQGRVSLAIGLAFLAVCLLAAEAIDEFAISTFLLIVRESLTIGGWVAMWRPMQIFLYDWWPVRRRRRTYLSLARSHVKVLAVTPTGS